VCECVHVWEGKSVGPIYRKDITEYGGQKWA